MNIVPHTPVQYVDTNESVDDTTESSQCQCVKDVALSSRSNGTKLRDYDGSRRDLEIENFDLIAKVKELLNTHKLWGPDGTYTFEDGERWAKLEGEDG